MPRLKLHTWIVIAMVLGTTIGALIGPDSPLFSGDLVLLQKGQAPALFAQPDEGRLPAPDRDIRGTVVSEQGDWVELALRGDVALRDGRWIAVPSDDDGSGRRVFLHHENLPPQRYSAFALAILSALSLVGDIFLRLLKMLVVPLVFVSVSAGVASLGDPRKLGKMGVATLGYFFATTVIAVTIGLTVSLLLRPGDAMPAAERARLAGPGGVAVTMTDLPSLTDRLREVVPVNPLEALAEGDMLQIIFFAVILGAALCLLDSEKSRFTARILDAATDVMVRMVHMVMVLAPVGVAALMAVVTARSGLTVMGALLAYGAVVLLGLSLHVSLCYIPAVRLLARTSVRRFFRAARPTQLLTFGTSSSSASLPVTMECAEKGLGISKHVSTFVLPVGSTVNMDGTALYQGVATVFVAQLYGLDLGAAELLQVVALATLASVGAAGVPGAGMVTLTMVLTSLGLPVEGVAIIMGIDRILDMFRSAVNVTGDLSCAAFVARVHGERPGSMPFQEFGVAARSSSEPAGAGD